jgi:hypothetical protein
VQVIAETAGEITTRDGFTSLHVVRRRAQKWPISGTACVTSVTL